MSDWADIEAERLGLTLRGVPRPALPGERMARGQCRGCRASRKRYWRKGPFCVECLRQRRRRPK